MNATHPSFLAQRVLDMDESATLAMTRRASEMRARGIDVISLSAGEPDFDTPQHIKDVAAKAMAAGKTKYTPSSGIPELKDAVVQKFRRDQGLTFDPSQVLISCGAKHSVYNFVHALVDPGEEVIIPAPFWTSYPDIVKSAGGRPVIVPMDEKSGFRLKPESLEPFINSKTKAILYSSPSNPTGAVWNEADLRALAEFLKETDIVTLSDEVYEHFVYGDARHQSIAQVSPELLERTVLINSVSKTYAMTGWRIGFAAGPREIVAGAAKIQSQATSNPNSIAQHAATEALNGDQSCIERMKEEYCKRRELMIARLKEIPNLTCREPEGAFYVFPNVSALFGKSHGGRPVPDSTALADLLLDEAHIATVAGSAFGSPQHIRISYATSTDNLTESMNRLSRFIRELI